MSAAPSGVEALREAVLQARHGFGETTPKLAIVFASMSYSDLEAMRVTARALLPETLVVGGSSGNGLVGPAGFSSLGVSVVLLGGDDLEVVTEEASVGSPDMIETVTAGARVSVAAEAASLRGFVHYTCLVFAPGIFTDGEAVVAAARKGAGAHAQLAGALTGDDSTMDRPIVITSSAMSSKHVVLVGIFSKSPVGIAAGHGYRALGPIRTVTKAEGRTIQTIDGEPALEVWLADARAAGAEPPTDPMELASYLGAHYGFGLTDRGREHERGELVMRTPISVGPEGVEVSAAIPEGTHIRVLRGTQAELLKASADVAAAAIDRAGGRPAGALVLICSGRQVALGDALATEIAGLRARVKAPIGGSLVYGEIARNVRDADAFFNTTVVVVAFGK